MHGFFGKKQYAADHEVVKTFMSGVLYLCNVLQFIIYRLNDRHLSDKQFARNAHQCSFHIAFQLSNKLYAINKQPLEEILSDISLVAYQLAIYELHKGFVFQGFAVINVTRSNHEVEKFSFLIANQVQLETEEPTHGAFSSLGYAFENLVNVYSLVSAYAEWCTVNKADTRAFTQKDLLDEQSQENSDFSFQFYKTGV